MVSYNFECEFNIILSFVLFHYCSFTFK